MLYGTLILTGTSIVSQFLGFVYRILLSRLIGAEVMGLYQLIMPVFSVIMALTAVGLTVAVSNLSSQYHARGNRAAIAQVLRRCLAVFLLLFAAVAAVVVLLYDPISVYLLGDARTQLGLLLLLPCILLTGVENLHKHFFYGTGNIRPPAAVELCEQFIRTGAVLGLLVVFLPQSLFLHTYINTDSCAVFSVILMFTAVLDGMKNGFNRSLCIQTAVGVILCALSYYNAYGAVLVTVILFISCFVGKVLAGTITRDGTASPVDRYYMDWRPLLRAGLFITCLLYTSPSPRDCS